MIKFIFYIFISFLSISNFSNAFANNGYVSIKYGISEHDLDVTVGHGTVTSSNDDEGYILSGGAFIGNNWGVDVMYFDLGSSSIFVESQSIFRLNKNNYMNNSGSSGTITNDISGYGTGLILSTNPSSDDFLGFSAFVKGGVQAWEKSGSTTILDNDKAFEAEFYNQGIGAYGGLGVSVNMTESISFDASYDIIGISNKGGFDNASSLLSAGLKLKF